MNKVPYSKDECCGCGVCSCICPTSAISMEADEEGFLYPVIDETKCIDCGICLKHCAYFHRKLQHDFMDKPCYILQHKDLNTRMKSRSGGVFVCCSDWVLQQGGTVYGAILNGSVCSHQRATTAEERDAMRYSKYVQSDTTHIYPSIMNDLKTGHKVLFSGTPCQVDALYSYLHRKKVPIKDLCTMDLICHGVASPKLFVEYISYLEKLNHGKVSDFQFRDKTLCGWDDHIESYKVNGHKLTSGIWRNIYNSNGVDRPSCYKCKYAAINRAGDITFGDAWGIRRVAPDFYDNRGASIVIINSLHGEDLLTCILASCNARKVRLKNMLQPNLLRPSQPKVNRKQLWEDYHQGGIDLLISKYGRTPLQTRIWKKVKHCLRKVKFMGKDVYLPGFYPLNN